MDTRDGHQRLCISVYLLLDEVTVGDSRDFLIFAFSLLFSSGPLFPRLRPLFIPSYSIRKNHPRCIPGLDSDLSTGHLGLYTVEHLGRTSIPN